MKFHIDYDNPYTQTTLTECQRMLLAYRNLADNCHKMVRVCLLSMVLSGSLAFLSKALSFAHPLPYWLPLVFFVFVFLFFAGLIYFFIKFQLLEEDAERLRVIMLKLEVKLATACSAERGEEGHE